MRYTCRPGIVLTKICGEWLLIPTRAASEYSPSIMHLQLPAMLTWRILEKGCQDEDICRVFQILFHCDEDEAKKKTEEMLTSFIERSMIICSENEL